MPTQKDFKRRVRARMRKTGEAYTAARAQILRTKTPPPAAVMARPSYAEIAGMSDEKVKKATGCDWQRWVYALDRQKAYALTHRELAKLIKAKYETPSWWTQTVAVGYERIKGLRARGQARDGSYSASKSRTFNVPVETLYAAWSDGPTRARWLGDKNVKIRRATAPRSIRLEQDGSLIVAMFTRRSASKSTVAIEEARLPSPEAAEAVKRYWSERLDDLERVIGRNA